MINTSSSGLILQLRWGELTYCALCQILTGSSVGEQPNKFDAINFLEA